jgi:hypothetical protein
MNRINYCADCNNEKYGVRTRPYIPHTCGNEFAAKQPKRLTVDPVEHSIEELKEGDIIRFVLDGPEYIIKEQFFDSKPETKVNRFASLQMKFIAHGRKVLFTGKNYYDEK